MSKRLILLLLHIGSLVLLGFGWTLDMLHIDISTHFLVDFNLFNEKHFQAPNTIVGSGSFGRITAADPGRVVQVAAKLIW